MNEGISEVVVRDNENEVVARKTQKLDIHRSPGSWSELGQFCTNFQSQEKRKLLRYSYLLEKNFEFGKTGVQGSWLYAQPTRLSVSASARAVR